MKDRKRRKYYRLLSIVISFVMIFTAVPLVPVFADVGEAIETVIPDTPINTEPITPEPIDPPDDGGDKWMLRRATLKCWYSDSNTAYAWVKKPSSVYYEVLDDADGTNIENRISYAMNEWNQALAIPFYRTSDSSANIRCVSASYNYFYTNFGIDIDLYSGAYTEYTTVPGEIVTTSWDGQEKI
jgi:hypothetical protein